MNLLLLEPEETAAEPVVLSDRRAAHLRDVVRVETGDRVRVGVVRGPAGTARVAAARAGEVALVLEPALRAAIASGTTATQPPVSVVLAVPRPKVLSRAVRQLASFGVARIDLVNAWRVDKSYLGTRRLQPGALALDARLGCEQGVTTWVPDVETHPRLMPFLDGPLQQRLAAGARGLIAHPGATSGVEGAFVEDSALIAAIGPEGGWIQRELDTFVERGFAPVTIGPGILRVETATAALMAQLQLLARLRADRPASGS